MCADAEGWFSRSVVNDVGRDLVDSAFANGTLLLRTQGHPADYGPRVTAVADLLLDCMSSTLGFCLRVHPGAKNEAVVFPAGMRRVTGAGVGGRRTRAASSGDAVALAIRAAVRRPLPRT